MNSQEPIIADLQKENLSFMKAFPGDSSARQAIHTVYGGAHLFKSDSAPKIGKLALASLEEYAPNFVVFARGIGLPGAAKLTPAALKIKASSLKAKNPSAWLASVVYDRVLEKLQREPVEDFRIDFEDGYGNRPDDEEDAHAKSTAYEVSQGIRQGTLPPFIGIRIKPLTEELRVRSFRTLDLFVSTLAKEASGKLPDNFVVTLPKITHAGQVAALVRLFEVLEQKNNLPRNSLKMEFMIETTQSIISAAGTAAIPEFIRAARGRCTAAHFGTYDYTASCNITAAHQVMVHPACDYAKHMMQVTLAGTGINMSDGATNIMPVGIHKADGKRRLTPKQKKENAELVHRAWQLSYFHIQHSLRGGFYQGWDLHPAQLPVRYAATYAFFLQGLTPATERLKNFMGKAALATLIGDVFDDAATGQGLLNYFLRALSCGAVTESEVLATGLTLDEIRTRSFAQILKNRRRSGG